MVRLSIPPCWNSLLSPTLEPNESRAQDLDVRLVTEIKALIAIMLFNALSCRVYSLACLAAHKSFFSFQGLG